MIFPCYHVNVMLQGSRTLISLNSLGAKEGSNWASVYTHALPLLLNTREESQSGVRQTQTANLQTGR